MMSTKIDNWIKIEDQQPPDEYVKVRDANGTVAVGIATYYPFRVEKRPGDEKKAWGWRGTVVPCESHWDGGWLIGAHEGLTDSPIGDIVEYALLDIPIDGTEIL